MKTYSTPEIEIIDDKLYDDVIMASGDDSFVEYDNVGEDIFSSD